MKWADRMVDMLVELTAELMVDHWAERKVEMLAGLMADCWVDLKAVGKAGELDFQLAEM